MARTMLEMKVIKENKTCDLIDLPLGCRPIGLKWVFKVKRNERVAIAKHKARLRPGRELTFRKSSRRWRGWNPSDSC